MSRILDTRCLLLGMILAGVAVGCGGDVTPPGPPAPPPAPQPAPAGLQIVGGSNQEGPPGAVLPAPIRILVTDAAGKPVPRVRVAFGAPDGGSFTPATVDTDDQGVALSAWRLGLRTGPQIATVALPGSTGIEAKVMASGTVIAGPATSTGVTLQTGGAEVQLTIPAGALAAGTQVSLQVLEASSFSSMVTLPLVRVEVGSAVQSGEFQLRLKIPEAVGPLGGLQLLEFDRATLTGSRVEVMHDTVTRTLVGFIRPSAGPGNVAVGAGRTTDGESFSLFGAKEYVVDRNVFPANTTVRYWVEVPSLASLPPAVDVIAATERAVERQWGAVLGANTYGISFVRSPINPHVVIGFGPVPEGARAVTRYTCPLIGSCASTLRAITLRDDHDWSTGVSSGYNIESTVLHELGHAAGLDHYYADDCHKDGTPTATHCGVDWDVMAWAGSAFLGLSCRDLDLVQYAYGRRVWLDNRCATSFRWIPETLPSPIYPKSPFGSFGVQVLDRAGRPAQSATLDLALFGPAGQEVVSALGSTDPDGTLVLPAWSTPLPAGRFVLFANGGRRVTNGQSTRDFNIVELPAAKLNFTTSPPNGTVNSNLSPAVQVAVQTAAGATVTTATNTVTLTFASNPTGATLAGTLSRAAVNGVATFNDLKIDKPGTYTLVASSPGLTPATSLPFTITGAAVAGPLTITNTVTGSPQPSGPFTITIDPGTPGEIVRTLPKNGFIQVTGLSAGQHTVVLSGSGIGPGSDCAIAGGGTASLTLPANGAGGVDFQVHCAPPGGAGAPWCGASADFAGGALPPVFQSRRWSAPGRPLASGLFNNRIEYRPIDTGFEFGAAGALGPGIGTVAVTFDARLSHTGSGHYYNLHLTTAGGPTWAMGVVIGSFGNQTPRTWAGSYTTGTPSGLGGTVGTGGTSAHDQTFAAGFGNYRFLYEFSNGQVRWRIWTLPGLVPVLDRSHPMAGIQLSQASGLYMDGYMTSGFENLAWLDNFSISCTP